MKEGFGSIEQLKRESPKGIKSLHLTNPQSIYKLLGEFSESPVFVSPRVDSDYCSEENCGVHFSHLLYKEGDVTEAQHIHKEHGGIYFAYTGGGVKDMFNGNQLGIYTIEGLSLDGWLADVVPIEPVLTRTHGSGRYARSGAVFIKEVYAFCTGPECSAKMLPSRFTEEGSLFCITNRYPDLLVPICNNDKEEFEERRRNEGFFQLAFRKTPEGISFSSAH